MANSIIPGIREVEFNGAGEGNKQCPKCGGSGDIFRIIRDGREQLVPWDEINQNIEKVLGTIMCGLCSGHGVVEDD